MIPCLVTEGRFQFTYTSSERGLCFIPLDAAKNNADCVCGTSTSTSLLTTDYIYIQIRNSIVSPIDRTISREILTVIYHVTANILLKRTNKLLVTLSYNWHKSSLSTRHCSGTTELYLVSSLETTQIRSSPPVMHTNNSCGLLPSAPCQSTELTSSWRTYTRTRIPRIRSVFLNLDSRHWVFYNLETRLGFLILHCVSNTFLTQCYANRVPRSS